MKKYIRLIRCSFVFYVFMVLLLFYAVIPSVYSQTDLSKDLEKLNLKLDKFNSYIIIVFAVMGLLLIGIVVIIYIFQSYLKPDIRYIIDLLRNIKSDSMDIQKRNEQIRVFREELQGVIKELTKQTIEQKKPAPSEISIQKPVKKTESEILAEIVELYNQGVKDSEKKDTFIRKYNPERVTVSNAMERRQNLKIPPIFRTANDGDYYAISIESGGKYAFVPRFDLTFDEIGYGAGAMSIAFDCPNFDPTRIYTNIQLVKPAIFKFDSSTNQWQCMQQGILNLERWIAKPQPVEVDLEKIKKEICEAYNTAMADPGKRGDFLNAYQCIRIGGKDEGGKPSFESMPYGEYFALPIKDSIYYAVVPSFSMTNIVKKLIQRVFPNYDQNVPNAKLLRPAMFEPNASKTLWELKEKGEFDLPPSMDMVTSLYNDGVNNAGKRDEFIQRYKPIIIGVTNVSGAPTFQTLDNGDYYAVAISNGYAVLPRFDVELNEKTYGSGALGHIYECYNYDGKTRYRGMKVLVPAIFEKCPSEPNWKLKDKGGLELGEAVETTVVEGGPEQNKAIQEIVDKYNAIRNSDQRNDFIKQYKCKYLSYNKEKKVLYEEARDSIGDYTTSYYATAVENGSYYIVLPKFLTPKFEMIIDKYNYDRLSPLFDFPGYESKGKSYLNAKLAKPAKIRERLDEKGNSSWEIIERGEIDLRIKGPGNQEVVDEKHPSTLGETDFIQELEKIKSSYNEAVVDKSKREEFKGKSKKNLELHIETGKKFRLKLWKKDKPTFKGIQNSDFSYYAVEIPGDNRYAIVPKFGLEIDKNKFESSIKDTFDCPDFNPKMKYSDVKVTRLATSNYDPEKEIWMLINKGELKLGEGKRV